jgi:Spy/CpxP family protein refolding chaperone
MLFKVFFLAISLVGLFFAAPGWGSAQNAPAPDVSAMPSQDGSMHRHHHGMRGELKSLDLTPDQKAQIKGFMKSYRESRDSANPETRKQLLSQIESVLTPDQKAKLESEMPQRHRE